MGNEKVAALAARARSVYYARTRLSDFASHFPAEGKPI